MTAKPTARSNRLTERHKARARLVLLTVVTLVLTPVAGVRSAPIWILYVAFAVLYSLWAVRLIRTFGKDRRLGYLLCLTDVAALLPLMVWTPSPLMQTCLIVLCAGGVLFTYLADQRSQARKVLSSSRRFDSTGPVHAPAGRGQEEPDPFLERAVRVRLEVYKSTGARFGLVVLRLLRLEEIRVCHGDEEVEHVLAAVRRRGLRLLGPDAQTFVLSGGRVAFLFATASEDGRWTDHPVSRTSSPQSAGIDELGKLNPYDIESFAMTLARRVCEHSIDGHKIECVVGWASCPADGLTGADLISTAETAARGTEAFRQVGPGQIGATGRTRAAAG